MARDMLMSHPSPDNIHIVPTVRCVIVSRLLKPFNLCLYSDTTSGLALSSRNVYLTPRERQLAAPALHAALQSAKIAWQNGMRKRHCISDAHAVINTVAEKVASGHNEDGINVRLDYIEMNDPDSFDILPEDTTRVIWESNGAKDRAVVLSGAMWVGQTRLIDNIILGDTQQLGVME